VCVVCGLAVRGGVGGGGRGVPRAARIGGGRRGNPGGNRGRAVSEGHGVGQERVGVEGTGGHTARSGETVCVNVGYSPGYRRRPQRSVELWPIGFVDTCDVSVVGHFVFSFCVLRVSKSMSSSKCRLFVSCLPNFAKKS